MEEFERIHIDGVFIIAVNIVRPTINVVDTFKKIIKEEINCGHLNLIIDLRRCEYIDSTFLGAIIVAAKMLINLGHKLKIVKTGSVGEYIFTQGNSSRILDKYSTREEAIKSFNGDI